MIFCFLFVVAVTILRFITVSVELSAVFRTVLYLDPKIPLYKSLVYISPHLGFDLYIKKWIAMSRKE